VTHRSQLEAIVLVGKQHKEGTGLSWFSGGIKLSLRMEERIERKADAEYSRGAIDSPDS